MAIKSQEEHHCTVILSRPREHSFHCPLSSPSMQCFWVITLCLYPFHLSPSNFPSKTKLCFFFGFKTVVARQQDGIKLYFEFSRRNSYPNYFGSRSISLSKSPSNLEKRRVPRGILVSSLTYQETTEPEASTHHISRERFSSKFEYHFKYLYVYVYVPFLCHIYSIV